MLPCSVYTLILIGIITAAVFRLIPPKYRAVFLCTVSFVVYTIWAGVPAALLLATQIIINAFISDRINKQKNARSWMVTGISLTVIILAFFKYKDFFLSDDSALRRLLIPLGISYYSFKMISYMIDSYRTPDSEKKSTDYLIYISFFPQLICGPISRFDEIGDYRKVIASTEDVGVGLYIILKGLFYKAVIADRLSPYTTSVFDSYNSHGFIALWMAVFFFAIQLYADFAGYSYIVIGICRIMGLRISGNFNLPYFSGSIREFWTRWHISLSSWLKDYIYIPLGGSRKGKARRIINILIVFAISGIWHGNTIAYLLWGLWHGIWNILSPRNTSKGIKRALGIIWTNIIVMFGWITFKTERISDLFGFIGGMFKFRRIDYAALVDAVMPFYNDYSAVAKTLTVFILLFVLFIMEYREYRNKTENRQVRAVLYMTAIVLLGVVGSGSFIYANY